MKAMRVSLLVGLVSLFCCLCLQAQQSAVSQAPSAPASATVVPNLVRFSGVLKDEIGKPLTGAVGVTFALYETQEGGAALWIETQNVKADANGNYSILLGSTRSDGVSPGLFVAGQARWLGIQVEGQTAEQPRVLLVSVPYALKAADAETLGGKPASAYMLSEEQAASSAMGTNGSSSTGAASRGVQNLGQQADAHKANQKSGGALSVGGSGTTDFIPIWTNSTTLGSSALFQTSGNVGLGTTTPGAKLDVTSVGSIGVQGTTSNTTGDGLLGNATATSGFTFGVQGFSSSPSGVGVQGASPGTGVIGFSRVNNGVVGISRGEANGSSGVIGKETALSGGTFGVQGITASPAGTGVLGKANATTGVNFGVSGQTASTSNFAAGVRGFASATTGLNSGVSGQTASTTNFAAGVNGVASATTGQVYGVSGSTNSTSVGAAGVNGLAAGTEGFVAGVFGNTPSTSGSGVSGMATATSGSTNGVIGFSASTSGNGVVGNATATSGNAVGVVGQTSSPGGAGGRFVNLSGAGVVLQGLSGSGFKQVFSVDAIGNGFYAGNLNVTGKLTKGSGSFKIDHPLDPANKYLSHSFVESPDMMDVYNGVLRLDAKGEAWVNLPEYFEALNRNFRYQLTSIGAPAPNLYVAREVSRNRFKIAGGKPRGTVSWQVTGIRQDAYANAHRIPVTEDKPPAEQGFYLHPELYGQPDSRRVGSGEYADQLVPDCQAPNSTALRP